MARWPGLVLAVVVAVTLAGAAFATPYTDACATMAEAGAKQHFDAADSHTGTSGAIGGPVNYDLAFATPSWALACLTAGVHVDGANNALLAIAAAVDTKNPATKGFLPWTKYGTPSVAPTEGVAYSLAATEAAACPLAACLILHRQAMTAEAQTAVAAALTSMGAALGRSKPESADTRRLYFAAACVAVGRANTDQGLVNRGLGEANAWLQGVQDSGLTDGHGPTTEASRLASLAWIKLLAPAPQGSWDTAWRLLWTDMLQRLQSGGGLLAGVQPYASRADYLDGVGPLRWLLPLAEGKAAPDANPADGYYCLPFVQPMMTAPALTLPAPANFTYTWGGTPLAQETTWSTPDCSLSTMTGGLESNGIPIFMTFPGRATRPTAYAFASIPCRVFSLQRGDTAMVNFQFDSIGWGPRTQAWTDIVLGPAASLKQISVLGQTWNGEPLGFDETWPVCVETDGAYIGVVPLWCGPADASTLTERVKPGILQWMPDENTGELVLRIYARQANYRLPKLENGYVAGMLVTVKPSSSMSFDDFVKSLRRIRYTKALEQREWRIPQQDEGHPVLDRYKPKPKSSYKVGHATDYSLTCLLEGKKWTMVTDMMSWDMRSRSITDQAPATGTTPAPATTTPPPSPPDLQFDTPLLKLAQGWRKLELAPDLAAALTPGAH